MKIAVSLFKFIGGSVNNTACNGAESCSVNNENSLT